MCDTKSKNDLLVTDTHDWVHLQSHKAWSSGQYQRRGTANLSLTRNLRFDPTHDEICTLYPTLQKYC